MCAAQQRYMTSEEKRLARTWFEEDANRLRRDPIAIRRYLKSGSIEAMRSVRPCAVSEQQIDRLLNLVNAKVKKAAGRYHVTVEFIRRLFRPKFCVRVLASALHQRGICFHTLREKPVLTSDDVKARLAFAKRYRRRSGA